MKTQVRKKRQMNCHENPGGFSWQFICLFFLVDTCVWPHSQLKTILVFNCLQYAKIPFLHTASDQKLDGRKAWGEGYVWCV